MSNQWIALSTKNELSFNRWWAWSLLREPFSVHEFICPATRGGWSGSNKQRQIKKNGRDCFPSRIKGLCHLPSRPLSTPFVPPAHSSSKDERIKIPLFDSLLTKAFNIPLYFSVHLFWANVRLKNKNKKEYKVLGKKWNWPEAKRQRLHNSRVSKKHRTCHSRKLPPPP